MADSPPDLQFERAEFAQQAPSATCVSCQRPITDAYWEVNGKVACERCLRQFEFERAQGSKLARVLKAIAYGAAAGALGALVWYAVREFAHLEVGLISIGIGIGVGLGVRKGSGGRGGRGYQVLAVALTYAAIVSTYVPVIVKSAFDGAHKRAPKAAASPTPASPADSTVPPPAHDPAPEPRAEKPSLGRFLLALVAFSALIAAVALAAPFLEGFQNIIGIAIIAFGLWEAWKINRATPLAVTGPHRVGAVPQPVP